MNKTKEELFELINIMFDSMVSGYKLNLTLLLNRILQDIKDEKEFCIIPNDTDEKTIRTLRRFGLSVQKTLDPDSFELVCKVSWNNVKGKGEINFSFPEDQLQKLIETDKLMMFIADGLIEPILVRPSDECPHVNLTIL